MLLCIFVVLMRYIYIFIHVSILSYTTELSTGIRVVINHMVTVVVPIVKPWRYSETCL